MLQGHTTAIVPCGNPTPKKLPTGGGEWPTFRTARAQRTVRPQSVDSEIVLVSSIAPEGWGPKEGGYATSPLHSRGSPTKGTNQKSKPTLTS